MSYSIMIILALLVAAVGGFLVLMVTILNNWKAGSRGHEEADAIHSDRTSEFEKCYNQCMIAENWEPDKGDRCESLCGSRLGSHPSI
jgi:cytochrome c-type biogenesis protein CcmH/NrfG